MDLQDLLTFVANAQNQMVRVVRVVRMVRMVRLFPKMKKLKYAATRLRGKIIFGSKNIHLKNFSNLSHLTCQTIIRKKVAVIGYSSTIL